MLKKFTTSDIQLRLTQRVLASDHVFTRLHTRFDLHRAANRPPSGCLALPASQVQPRGCERRRAGSQAVRPARGPAYGTHPRAHTRPGLHPGDQGARNAPWAAFNDPKWFRLQKMDHSCASLANRIKSFRPERGRGATDKASEGNAATRSISLKLTKTGGAGDLYPIHQKSIVAYATTFCYSQSSRAGLVKTQDGDAARRTNNPTSEKRRRWKPHTLTTYPTSTKMATTEGPPT